MKLYKPEISRVCLHISSSLAIKLIHSCVFSNLKPKFIFSLDPTTMVASAGQRESHPNGGVNGGYGAPSAPPPEGHDPFQPYKVEKFDEGLRYDTLQIHAGHRPDKETHARAVPIYNSVVSLLDSTARCVADGLTSTLLSLSFSRTAPMQRGCARPRKLGTSTVASPT